MPRKVNSAKLDDAIALYLSGQGVHQIASELGIGASTLCRELKARGIVARTNRLDLDATEIRHLYVDEQLSEFEIALRMNVSRNVIRRHLLKLGVPVRSSPEANALRMARMDGTQRRALTAAANEAARGRTRTWTEKCKLAQTREARPWTVPHSTGEKLLAQLLTDRGVKPRVQVAVGPYNLDFVIGSVAVEVLGGTWHAGKAVHLERTPYILDQGWTLVFIWHAPTKDSLIVAGGAEYVIALAKEAGGNPALVGQYRVIRGDGQLLAEGCRDDDSFALVKPTKT